MALPTTSIRDARGGTKVVVLKPVTAAGQAAAGWTTSDSGNPSTYCDQDGGFGALSPNIYFCGPTVFYTPACWPSQKPKHVLCLHNPRARLLNVWSVSKPLRPIPPPHDPGPIALDLTNGLRCDVRIGGAWGQPAGHPELYGTYSCKAPGTNKEGPDLWAAGDSWGIDRTHPVWTVLVATDGSGPVTKGEVATAYYVATAP